MKQFLFYCMLGSYLYSGLGIASAQMQTAADTITYAQQITSQEQLIEAQKYFLLEDFEQALKSLNNAIDADPNNDAAYFKQAEVYLRLERYGEGLKAIEKALTLERTNKYYYLIASELAALDQAPDQVSGYYLQMVNSTNDYFMYLEEIAKHFISQGKWQQALELIDFTEQKTNLSPAQYQIKVDILVNANLINEAKQLLNQLQGKFPGERQFVFQEARLLSLNKEKEKAIELLKAQKQPTVDMQLLLAELQGGKGQTPEDQKLLLLQSFSNPNADAQVKTLLMGQYLMKTTGNIDLKLVDSLQLELESDYQDEPVVLENGAITYEILAQKAEGENRRAYAMASLERQERLILIKPGDFETWQNLLNHYATWQNWQKLEVQADEALLRFPNQIRFYIYLAEAKMGLEKTNEAQLLLRQVLLMANSYPELKSLVLSRQADLAYQKQNMADATKLYEKALNIENPHPDAILSYGRFLSVENPKQALLFIEPWIEQGAKNEAIFRIKAQALFTLSEFEKAKSTLEKDFSSISALADGQSLELLGDIYFKLNAAKEALKLWEKAKFAPGVSGQIDEKINEKNISKK